MTFTFDIHELLFISFVIVLIIILLFIRIDKHKKEAARLLHLYIHRNDVEVNIFHYHSIEKLKSVYYGQVIFTKDIGNITVIMYKDTHGLICTEIVGISKGQAKLRELRSHRPIPPAPPRPPPRA